MGDFSDDYGGYDILGLYERRDDDRRAQRAKLLTPPTKRAWVGLTETKIKEIWLKGKDHGDDWRDVLALARSFEAELKELNK
jgi:hypothetical protein